MATMLAMVAASAATPTTNVHWGALAVVLPRVESAVHGVHALVEGLDFRAHHYEHAVS